MSVRLPICLLLCLLVGCSKSSERRPPIDKVDLVATVYPLGQVAQAVGGPVVKVRWLVESGQVLRGLSEANRAGVQTARIVFFNSAVTEPWIGSDSGMALGGERLLRLDLMTSARPANAGGFLWLDPTIVREAAVELRNRLLAQRPRQASILNDRTDAFLSELDALTNSEWPKFEPFAGRHVLALRHDFDPMLARLKMVVDVPLDRSATDLNDGDVRYLRSNVGAAKLLLVADDTPPATRERLKEIGLPIVAIDTLGSSATSGRDTYVEILRFDYEALLNGLNAKNPN